MDALIAKQRHKRYAIVSKKVSLRFSFHCFKSNVAEYIIM
jgi:hypothetical protein